MQETRSFNTYGHESQSTALETYLNEISSIDIVDMIVSDDVIYNLLASTKMLLKLLKIHKSLIVIIIFHILKFLFNISIKIKKKKF